MVLCEICDNIITQCLDKCLPGGNKNKVTNINVVVNSAPQETTVCKKCYEEYEKHKRMMSIMKAENQYLETFSNSNSMNYMSRGE